MMWWTLALASAGCDPAGIDAIVEAVPQVRPEQHAMMAATGFAQACTTPRGLVEAARTLPSVAPDMRRMIDLKAATDAPQAWMAVCTGRTEGLRVLAKMVELSRDQQRDHLWTGCSLKDLGWFTREEWRVADGSIVVALAGAQHAADEGIGPRKVRTLARALAGIGGRDEGRRREAFEDPFLVPPSLAPYDPEPTGRKGARDPDKAGFRRQVEPTWRKRALREGGRCTVRVSVSKAGDLDELTFLDCPKALRKDVKRAVEASKLRPRRKDGKKAPGRFKATYRAK